MPSLKVNPDHVVEEARQWIGTAYHHQTSLRGVGCDCLGLLRGVRRTLGGIDPEYIPPYTSRGECCEADLEEELSHYFQRCNSLIYKVSDILVFRWREYLPPTHVAIVSAQGEQECWMIHAHAGNSVTEVPVDEWWQRHLTAVFSFSV